MIRRNALLVAALAASCCAPAIADDDPTARQGGPSLEAEARPVLDRYCVRCHGPEKQSADLRLDTLGTDLSTLDVSEAWLEIRDRLTLGEMPPEGEARPDDGTVARLADRIAVALDEAEAARDGGGPRVVLRRLNRDEYNNTVRDLLGVDFEPAADFPEDPPAHGFDNVGAALQVSPLLLEKYLDAARAVVDRALVAGPKPVSHTWHIEVEEAHRSHQFQGRESAGQDELWVADPVTERHRYLVKGGGTAVRDGWLVQQGAKDESAAGFRWFRLPASGAYLVRIRAAAAVPTRDEVVASARRVILRNHEQGNWKKLSDSERGEARDRWEREEWPALEAHFRTDPMYDYGPPRMKVATDEGVIIAAACVEAPTDEPRVYEFSHEFEAVEGETVGVSITNDYSVPSVLENFWFQRDPDFARPELLIDWVEFEGVHVDRWPPAGHDLVLLAEPDRTGDEHADARLVLERFLTRAYRRPVDPAEVEPFLALFDAIRPEKPSFLEAIKVPLTAALVSPHFLYLVEPGDDAARPLDQYEVAGRLSYFLWSTMPDAALFRLAAEGRLREPAVLTAQVDRMLADPKSEAFVRNFAGQWLGLRELGANPPVANLFPRYDEHLEASMRRESEATFAEFLHRGLDVRGLLGSDQVVINERLARFYGIPGVKGDHFRRVPVPDGVRRGGLMTQASVLTLTSNGTRTSPVVRGVWILENLLGDPPPPPPPDAGDLAPEVPGIDKATVRDRLQAHRRLPQCASCHSKIDPLGFALENYDADGRWRDRYGFGYNGRVGDDDPLVDASGRLPGGRSFHGVAGLQSILLADEDRFLACLADKLLVYALGRGLTPADRPVRDRLVADLRRDGYTLRGLIAGIVTSEPFLTK